MSVVSTLEIKAIALDVDGVLTDGTFWWGANGEEYKRFSFADVMGVSLGRKAGFVFALISGENSPQVLRFATKMGITDVFPGCKDKTSALKTFAEKYNLELSQVCFMGDDINDVPALELAGLAAAPATAHESAKQKAGFVTRHDGGLGAVRELIDLLLSQSEQSATLEQKD